MIIIYSQLQHQFQRQLSWMAHGDATAPTYQSMQLSIACRAWCIMPPCTAVPPATVRSISRVSNTQNQETELPRSLLIAKKESSIYRQWKTLSNCRAGWKQLPRRRERFQVYVTLWDWVMNPLVFLYCRIFELADGPIYNCGKTIQD